MTVSFYPFDLTLSARVIAVDKISETQRDESEARN